MRVLITGGGGFVGSHLAEACLEAGDQVHVAFRSSDERLRELGDRIGKYQFDLASSHELRACLRHVRPHVIYHLAASPRRAQRVDFADVRENVREDLDCFLGVLCEAAGSRHPPLRFIRTGSLAEYGCSPTPHREEAREMPQTVYAAGLIAAAHYASALQSRLPFPVATARLSLIFGPKQSSDYLIPSLIQACLTSQPVTVLRPDDRRDLLFVRDAVEALRLMSRSALTPDSIVNVASGCSLSMRQVAALVVEATKAAPDVITYLSSGGPGGISNLSPSPELAARALGWRASTDIRDGLAQTIEWHRTHPEARPQSAGATVVAFARTLEKT